MLIGVIVQDRFPGRDLVWLVIREEKRFSCYQLPGQKKIFL
jgi:hypothetical protein